MVFARKALGRIPDPNTPLWNVMLKGYAQNELYKDVIFLFCRMKSMGVKPNCFTFPIVLKSCGKIKALKEGEVVFCMLTKIGYKANPYVGTTLIELYSCGEQIGSAYKVFVEMLERNVVAWTSMVSGYISCGDLNSARRFFDLAPERDVVLWNTMVSGYIEAGNMLEARKIFEGMPNPDVMSWNTMLIGYADNADVESCEKLFEEMPARNVFSWNGLIGGYAKNGRSFEVLNAFKRMLVESDALPNDATLVTVLSACSRLGDLNLGKWVHVYAENNGYKGNIYVGNALIDMYAKCGIVESAMSVFKAMDTKDLISWNSIINGLALHGRGADSLDLFSEMRISGEKPDGITFVGILCACAHMGLVEEGFSYFETMVCEYSIVPQIEHYGCMVDLLARAGLLESAVDFVRKMPMEADGVIWTSLLGACRIYKNVEVAELALSRLVELGPTSPANYVMLSNIYGDAGRWKDVARFKVAMRDAGSRKLPGCSLIEVDDSIVEFYSLDERHPRSEEIYEALKVLTKHLRFGWSGPKACRDGAGNLTRERCLL